MSENWIDTVIVILGMAVAAFSVLPYGWAHIVAASVGAALAVYRGVPVAASAVRGRNAP